MRHSVLRFVGSASILLLPLLLLPCLPLTAGSSDAPAVVNVRIVAITDQASVGTGAGTTFSTLDPPVLNRHGNIVFKGTVKGAGIGSTNEGAVWVEQPDSAIDIVAWDGTQPPGMTPGWVFSGIGSPTVSTQYLIGEDGDVVIAANAYNADSFSTLSGLWAEQNRLLGLVGKQLDVVPVSIGDISNPRLETFTELRMTGDGSISFMSPGYENLFDVHPPGPIGGVAFFASHIPGYDTSWRFGTITGSVLSDNGTSAFSGRMDSYGVPQGWGLFKSTGGVTTAAYTFGTPVPGGTAGERFSTYTQIMINDRDNAAFVGGVTDSGFTRPGGVWAERNGGLDPVLRFGEQAPGTDPGVVFNAIQSGGLASWDIYYTRWDEIVVKAQLSGTGVTTANDVGVWREGAGGLELVAREGSQVPGLATGITFSSIDRLVCNKEGGIVILGTLAGPGISTANDRGIWVYDGKGSFIPVVVKGDNLLTKDGELRTVYGVGIAGGVTESSSNGEDGRGSPFSATGILAFQAQFFDAPSFRQGVCKVDLSNIVRVRYIPVQLFQRLASDSLSALAGVNVEAGKYTPEDPFDPYLFTKVRLSDDHGVIFLDTSVFHAGDPFLIRYNAYKKPSPKGGHGEVDDAEFEATLDNLVIQPSGLLRPDTLNPAEDDTTVTVLAHGTIRFHLVVSVEWPADQYYIDSLFAALRNAGNYLYDVSNGQACFGKIAIYDNKSHWEDADIRIHASNLQWPKATVFGIDAVEGHAYFPPGWYDPPNRNGIADDRPVNPDRPYFYRTMIHELGHYAFGFYDEYIDKDGNKVGGGVNYGFMDYQYPEPGDPMTSEMSATHPAGYEMTGQYEENGGKSCWEFFDSVYSRTYGIARVNILTPAEVGPPSGLDYLPGPNDDLSAPDIYIGRDALMTGGFTGSSAPNAGKKFVDASMNPLGNIAVALLKNPSNRFLYHGATSDSGMMGFFGADLGDEVIAYGLSGPIPYAIRDTVRSGLSTGGATPLSSPVDLVVMHPVAGDFRMFTGVMFDAAGNVSYATTSNRNFPSAPQISVYTGGAQPLVILLAGDSAGYTAALPDTLPAERHILFSAPDSLGAEFLFMQNSTHYAVDSATREIVGSMDNFRLRFDSVSADIAQVEILTSAFSPPEDGLPALSSRISDVHSIRAYPAPSVFSGRLTVTYGNGYPLPPSPWLENATIYHWNGAWQPLATVIDTAHKTASAQFASEGFYAVFMDPTLTGVGGGSGELLPQEYRLYQNYPNPFNPVTTFAYDLPARVQVSLKVYNVLGQLVGVLVDGETGPGRYTVQWDAPAMPSGVYLYRLTAGSFTDVGKLVLVR